jgi:hypothetical protein
MKLVIQIGFQTMESTLKSKKACFKKKKKEEKFQIKLNRSTLRSLVTNHNLKREKTEFLQEILVAFLLLKTLLSLKT